MNLLITLSILVTLTACQKEAESNVSDSTLPTGLPGDIEAPEEAPAAEQLLTGEFNMFAEPDHQPTGCDHGTHLILDNAELMGKIAYTTRFVEGFCEIFVAPNPTLYHLTESSKDSCNSTTHKGSAHTDEGLVNVVITDHRLRICDDIVEAQIIMEIGDKTLYSQDN